MNQIMIRVLVALFTFTIGWGSARLLISSSRHLAHQPIKVEINSPSASKPDFQHITFSDHPVTTGFQTDYYSSDGVHLRYGCFEQASPSRATGKLREALIRERVIERTPELNNQSERIGERVVIGYPQGAEIVWTEGPRIFHIEAPSLKYALLFEKSRVWVGNEHCINIEVLRREVQTGARPNNSLNPTAR